MVRFISLLLISSYGLKVGMYILISSSLGNHGTRAELSTGQAPVVQQADNGVKTGLTLTGKGKMSPDEVIFWFNKIHFLINLNHY